MPPGPVHLAGDRGAVVDASGNYRYLLWRRWDASRPRAGFVLLNPSTADADHDDATTRRCSAFAREWGCGSFEVVNLFAWRSPTPRALRAAADPIGPENVAHLRAMAERCAFVVAGWGNAGVAFGGDLSVLSRLNLRCLGVTKLGAPRHPLYVRRGTALRAFALVLDQGSAMSTRIAGSPLPTGPAGVARPPATTAMVEPARFAHSSPPALKSTR